MATAAVIYKKDGYDTSGKRLLGRQSASEGFLKALVSHTNTDNFYCYTDTEAEFREFLQRVNPWVSPQAKFNWIPSNNLQALAAAGNLYRPDPVIAELAWQRRRVDQRSYSICGVTHTVASKEAISNIGELLIAPIQPWDALICSSNVVKKIIEQTLGDWSEYLAQRLNAKPKINLNLPVIPLGVDCDFFPNTTQSQNIRQQIRKELAIAPDDIVVLFVGRLIFHAKGHPVPMYIALEKAAIATGKKIHLIQAGWFEDEDQEFSFKNTAALFCPSVKAIFLDGRPLGVRKGIWSAADIFISLSDNIQETFGLTPIEAMAAGLPVVVSDWNGYQETVRHEIDGFRIPTLMTPESCGLEYSASYFDGSLNYSTYIGHMGMNTAVDVDACASALTKLINHPELRQKMGENGKARAHQVYDWSVIIKSYEQLWEQLGEIRSKTQASVPWQTGKPLYPLCDDPTRVYAHYPTKVLDKTHKIALGSQGTTKQLETLIQVNITGFGGNKRLSQKIMTQIVDILTAESPLSVDEIVSRFNTSDPMVNIYFYRTLVYLMKFDVLRLVEN